MLHKFNVCLVNIADSLVFIGYIVCYVRFPSCIIP